jgi:hypothetical protein
LERRLGREIEAVTSPSDAYCAPPPSHSLHSSRFIVKLFLAKALPHGSDDGDSPAHSAIWIQFAQIGSPALAAIERSEQASIVNGAGDVAHLARESNEGDKKIAVVWNARVRLIED